MRAVRLAAILSTYSSSVWGLVRTEVRSDRDLKYVERDIAQDVGPIDIAKNLVNAAATYTSQAFARYDALQSEPQPEPQPESQSAERPAAHPAARPAAQPAAQPAARPAAPEHPKGVIAAREVTTVKKTTKLRSRHFSPVALNQVVFINTPASGASCVADMLNRVCENHKLKCFRPPKHIPPELTFSRKGLWEVVNYYQQEKKSLNIWSSHSVMAPKAFEILVPGNLKFAVFTEPLSRVLSGLKQLSADEIRAQTKALRENREVENCGSKGGRSVGTHLDVDDITLLDQVLLSEEYDLSLILMRRRLGWKTKDIMYRVEPEVESPDIVKATEEFEAYISSPRVALSAAAIQYLNYCVEGRERTIYRTAARRFEKQWWEMTTFEQQDVRHELAQFREHIDGVEECCQARPHDVDCIRLAPQYSASQKSVLASPGTSDDRPSCLSIVTEYRSPAMEPLVAAKH